MSEMTRLTDSIHDVATDGLDLSISVREIVAPFPSTATHVQDLATSLSLFCRTFRQLGVSLDSGASPVSATALETIDEMLQYSQGIYDQIDDMIYRFEKDAGGDKNRVGDFLRWDFKKSKVRYLTGRLDVSQLTLAIMLQIFQIQTVMIATEYT